MERELPVVGKYEKLVPDFGVDLAEVVAGANGHYRQENFTVLERGYFMRFGLRETSLVADREGFHERFFPKDVKTPDYVLPKDLVDALRKWEEVNIFRHNSYRLLYHGGKQPIAREERATVIKFSGLSEAEILYLAINVADR